MAANPVLSEGKQVKSALSAARKGSQEKKTTARKAPFADLMAGMALIAGNPGKNRPTGTQSGQANLGVAAQVFPGHSLTTSKVVTKKQAPGKSEGSKAEPPDQAVRPAAPQSPAVSGKEAMTAGQFNRLQPIAAGSLRSKAGEVSRANIEVGKSAAGVVYSGRSAGNLEAPGTNERGHPSAGVPNAVAVQPEQSHDSVAVRTDAVREGNRAEGGDGKQKPDPGPAGANRDIKPGDTDNGTGSLSGLSSAARMSEMSATQTMVTGPERAGLSQVQMDALMDRMVHLVKSAPSSLEIQLKPEILGNVNILVESRDGAINIMIAAQNNDTASMLNSNLASMRDHLEQQGINLQQMEVNQGYRENRDQSANQPERGRRPAGSNEVAPEEMMISGSQSAASRRNRPGLNILA